MRGICNRTMICWVLRSISLPEKFIKHRMHHNTLNRMFKILRHREHMILSSSIYEKTYLHGSLEGVLEAIQVSSL